MKSTICAVVPVFNPEPGLVPLVAALSERFGGGEFFDSAGVGKFCYNVRYAKANRFEDTLRDCEFQDNP